MSEHPLTDAYFTGPCQRMLSQRVCAFCYQLEDRLNEAVLALREIDTFASEDYHQEFATPAYRAAVERMWAVLEANGNKWCAYCGKWCNHQHGTRPELSDHTEQSSGKTEQEAP